MGIRETRVGYALDADVVRAAIVSIIATTVGLTGRECDAIDDATPIDDGPLGIDSLDLINITRAVGIFFDLYASGSEEVLLQRRTIGGWVHTVLEAASETTPTLTFRTSGSTGEPVDCRHAMASLAAEVEVLAELFDDRSRVVGIVPRHHIYGFLFTALLPQRLGRPFTDLRGASIGEIHRSLRAGDLFIGFPLRLDELAESRVRFPGDVVCVTSTGPCRKETIAALSACGIAKTFEIYGSSQTAGVAWRTDPDAPYRLFPYWSLDSSGLRLSRDAARSPDGTQESFALPDRLAWRGDGFDVVGRHDGAVSVGGINVFPTRIAETIRAHPDVVDCSVRPMRLDEGTRLKAFVVLRSDIADDDVSREALRRWIHDTLPVAARPKPITFGPTLPRDAQGKTTDW